jgi:uncharacterized membrane protein
MTRDEELHPDHVRTLLLAVPAPASRVDVQRAVETGRRRARIRNTVRAGLSAIVVLGTVIGIVTAVGQLRAGQPAVGTAPPSVVAKTPPATPVSTEPKVAACQGQVLTSPTGASVGEIRGGDPSGRYVIADAVQGFDKIAAVLWTDGTPMILPYPPAVNTVQANDVNSHGVVVGTGFGDSQTTFAWVYRGGATTKLPKPSGYTFTLASGVNAAGDIVGAAWSRDKQDVAVLWPATDPERPRVLAAPELAWAFDITDDGSIVGTLNDGGNAYAWAASGTGRFLANPTGTTRGKAFAASSDWVVGWVRPDAGDGAGPQLLAARWNLRTGEATAYPHIAGPARSVSLGGDLTDADGHVVRNGQAYILPHPDSAHAEPGSAVSISEDGTVVVGSAGQVAVVWRC